LTIALISAALGALLGVLTLPKWRRTCIPLGYSDTVLQSLVMKDPSSYRGSMAVPYAAAVPSLAVWVWLLPYRWLGIDPVRVEAFRYVLQSALAAAGAGLLAFLLSPHWTAAMMAVLLLLGSHFAEVGWWLRPRFGFLARHAGLAVALGILLIGMQVQAAGRWPWLGAGLLCSYHPIHGVLVTGMLLLLRWTGAAPVGPPGIVAAAWFAIGIAPLFVYGAWQRRRAHAVLSALPAPDWTRWWAVLRSRTPNVFARAGLNTHADGQRWRMFFSPPALVLAVSLLAIATVRQTLHAPMANGDPGGAASASALRALRAMQIVALVGGAGFLSQLVAVDWMRLKALVPVAAARATVYMTFFSIAAWVWLARHAVECGQLVGLIVVLLALIALTRPGWRDNSWLAFFAFLPLLSWVPLPSALGTLVALLPTLVAAVALATFVARRLAAPEASELAQYGARLLAGLRFEPRDEWPLGVLGVAALLAWGWGSGLHHPPPLPLDGNLLLLPVLALLALLYLRRYWTENAALASDWEEVQTWVRQNTPAGSVFATPPELTGFEIFSRRPKLLDGMDVQFCVYLPALEHEVSRRCQALGVNIADLDRDRAELMPALRDAYAVLDRPRLADLQKQFGVQFAVINIGSRLPQRWDPAQYLFRNRRFAVVSASPVIQKGAP